MQPLATWRWGVGGGGAAAIDVRVCLIITHIPGGCGEQPLLDCQSVATRRFPQRGFGVPSSRVLAASFGGDET